MLRPTHRAVCHRGDDFCNPRVQVYGCWERHELPPFYCRPTSNLQIPAAGTPCAIDGYERVARGAQAGQKNSFDQHLQLRFREWCAEGGGRRASLRVPMFGLQLEILIAFDFCGTLKE